LSEIIRKLALVANWGFFGGFGVVIGIMAISNESILFLFALGFFITGAIVHKIINWVFD